VTIVTDSSPVSRDLPGAGSSHIGAWAPAAKWVLQSRLRWQMISVLSRAETQPDQRTAGRVVPAIRKRTGCQTEEYHPKYHPCSRSFGINFFILMEPPAGLEPATC